VIQHNISAIMERTRLDTIPYPAMRWGHRDNGFLEYSFGMT